MSYPYDTNPWDDNYGSQTAPTSQQPNAGAAYAHSDSYGNQYDQQYQYQQDQSTVLADPSGYQADGGQNMSPVGGQDEPIKQQAPQQKSALRRFLSQHVPLCGSIMDTLAGINLPFIDALVQHINRDLLISKIFYFFFYSAFGSLFPLMGVYFKQLGMNPAQVGILTGVRPFIEIFSAPFWHSLAEKFQKSKALLLFSLLSWIVFTYSLAHIRPPASACVAFNDTDYVLYTPYSANDLSNYEVNSQESMESTALSTNEVSMSKSPDREVKDVILASEESQNDQRKRRRRKRQVSSVADRFAYSVDRNTDDGYESHNDLNLGDLENDFDDHLLVRNHELSDSDDTISSEYDESSITAKTRLERSVKDVDYVLGESEEPEPEEEKKQEEQNNKNIDNNMKKMKQKGKESQQDEEQEEEEEEAEERAKGKSNAVNEPATTLPTTTTTMTTAESAENFVTQAQINKTKKVYKQRHKTPPTHIVGMSPITVEYAINYNKEKHSKFVTPMFSTIVYKLDDIKEVFFLLLLLISLGEFFSAPALTLADSATLSYLGENTDLYGRQRLFGSLSWAVTLLLVGMALDNATSIADHPCGPHQRERSYTVCFIIFSLLMACALLIATQFRFNYPKGGTGANQALVATTTDSKTVVTTTVESTLAGTGNIDEFYASTQPRSIFNTAPPVNAPPSNVQQGKEKFEFLDKWKSAVFAQNTKELPEWVNVFRQFKNSLHLTYLFITWFLGCGVGLVFTFLFWHLQDVGGTPTLFGICSVINHISEILAYFFSFSFIKRFGHTKVLSVGLGCNVIRFLYVGFLTNPYYALPFELVQGITHAACFAACCSYISHVSKPELRTSTQGVMQGLHHGIGRACGALIGGYMINAIGSRASFCIYGLLSGCVLAGFLYVRKKASELVDEEVKIDDSEALGGYGAPQGVPSAIPVQTTTATTQDIDYQW